MTLQGHSSQVVRVGSEHGALDSGCERVVREKVVRRAILAGPCSYDWPGPAQPLYYRAWSAVFGSSLGLKGY
jgi:hypothetical protein